MKRCTKCGETKPVEAFHREASRTDGRYPWCKDCAHKRRNAWYQKNREKNLAYQREWRERNKEKKRASDAAWREANSEHRRAQQAAWREATREERRAKHRQHYRANKDRPEYRAKRREAKRNRRAKQHGADISPVLFDEILQRDLGMCGICVRQILEATIELDHIVPLAAGGAHAPENLQLAHRACNRRKSDRIDFTLADVA